MQLSRRSRVRTSLFVFSFTPSSICSAGQLASRTAAQLEEVFNRLTLVRNAPAPSLRRTVMGWFVKITRGWWEGSDWGKRLRFTSVCTHDYNLSLFFFTFPGDKPQSNFTPPFESALTAATDRVPVAVWLLYYASGCTKWVILKARGRTNKHKSTQMDAYGHTAMDVYVIYIAASVGSRSLSCPST